MYQTEVNEFNNFYSYERLGFPGQLIKERSSNHMKPNNEVLNPNIAYIKLREFLALNWRRNYSLLEGTWSFYSATCDAQVLTELL